MNVAFSIYHVAVNAPSSFVNRAFEARSSAANANLLQGHLDPAKLHASIRCRGVPGIVEIHNAVRPNWMTQWHGVFISRRHSRYISMIYVHGSHEEIELGTARNMYRVPFSFGLLAYSSRL